MKVKRTPQQCDRDLRQLYLATQPAVGSHPMPEPVATPRYDPTPLTCGALSSPPTLAAPGALFANSIVGYVGGRYAFGETGQLSWYVLVGVAPALLPGQPFHEPASIRHGTG